MKKNKLDIMDFYAKPEYRGKILIVANDKFYAVKTGREANSILKKAEKENPKDVPQIAFVPKPGFLIL